MVCGNAGCTGEEVHLGIICGKSGQRGCTIGRRPPTWDASMDGGESVVGHGPKQRGGMLCGAGPNGCG